MQNTPQGGTPSGNVPQQSIYPGGPARRPAWWYWVGGGIVAVVLCCAGIGIGSLANHSGDTSTTTAGNSGGGTTAKAGPTAVPTATHTPQWTTVQTFSGTSSQKTPLFTVPNEWRIVWTCKKSDQFGGNFIVEVANPDGTPVDLAVNTTDNDGSTTYEHQGGGQVYLDIQTFNEQWSVQVQVQK